MTRTDCLTCTYFMYTNACMATTKRRKPAKERKERSIQIRVTDAQKTKLAEAAARAGLGLSSWMLTVSLAAAEAARSS